MEFLVSYSVYYSYIAIFRLHKTSSGARKYRAVTFVLCAKGNQVEEDETGGPCSTNGEKRNAYRLLLRKPEGKRPLGRPRRRWVDNIRMNLGEVGWDDVDWIGLAKDRNRWRALVNSVLNLRVPRNAEKLSSDLASSGLSSSVQLHIVS
jgi:hypothetical protein